MEEDVKALHILEKAVYKAQESLEKTKYFQPFLMLLTGAGELEIYENELKDTTESYAKLKEELTQRIKVTDIDVMVLVVDTAIPEQFSEGISSGIRLHLEEKSQLDKKIGARFLSYLMNCADRMAEICL